MAVALDYCDTVNSNIELFLKDKSKKIEVNLENIEPDFSVFWSLIRVEGDIDAALQEFKMRYNASEPREIDQHSSKSRAHLKKQKPVILRVLLKVKRLILKFPGYVRDA